MFINDGTEVKPGDVAMIVEGKVQSLLQTERLMLNVMQRMSGIATMTRKYARQLEGTHTRVLDTRKTTPGMRILEKMAVKIGGGVNHRIGLFDMILLKDNHVAVSYTHLDVYKRQLRSFYRQTIRWKHNIMELAGCIPVSYTHLDVYKRQI